MADIAFAIISDCLPQKVHVYDTKTDFGTFVLREFGPIRPNMSLDTRCLRIAACAHPKEKLHEEMLTVYDVLRNQPKYKGRTLLIQATLYDKPPIQDIIGCTYYG
jgi:hypothetical protein